MTTLSPARIRAARLEAGLSLRGAARVLEVSKTTITNSERGETTPGGDLLGRMASAYRVPVDAFYVGHDENAGRPGHAETENGQVSA